MKYRFLKPMLDSDGGTGAGSGTAGADGGTGAEGSASNNSTATANTENDSNADKGTDTKTDKDIEKLLQIRLDKAMADERKKTAALNKELDKMKREKMTADEIKKYDDEKRDQALAEREKAITEKENRYYAITAIKKAGLDDGGDTALKVVDLVVGATNEETDTKVAALNELVNKLVDAKVDEKFKGAGRTPNQGGKPNNGSDNKSLAEKLGKRRAEQAQKSNDVLKHYL